MTLLAAVVANQRANRTKKVTETLRYSIRTAMLLIWTDCSLLFYVRACEKFHQQLHYGNGRVNTNQTAYSVVVIFFPYICFRWFFPHSIHVCMLCVLVQNKTKQHKKINTKWNHTFSVVVSWNSLNEHCMCEFGICQLCAEEVIKSSIGTTRWTMLLWCNSLMIANLQELCSMRLSDEFVTVHSRQRWAASSHTNPTMTQWNRTKRTAVVVQRVTLSMQCNV